MPLLNGQETLKAIRTMEKFKDTPVIFFTTSSFGLDKAFARKNKVGFITKPLDVHQMELITEQFLEYCTDEVKQKLCTK
jgi:CheY-like chemotaxis protein